MDPARTLIAITALVALGACAVPRSPSVAVLPGGGKDMAAFNADDIACREYSARRALEKSPPPDAMGLGTGPAVVEARGRAARGNDTETGTGSMFGGAPAPESDNSFTAQQRFDTAYVQCMSAKGHKVPVNQNMSS